MTSHLYPTPLHSPLEEYKPTSANYFNFPIFHTDFASKPSNSSNNDSPFCMNTMYLRPGEAVYSLDNYKAHKGHRARANSFPRSYNEMENNMYYPIQRHKLNANLTNSSTLHELPSAPQDEACVKSQKKQFNPSFPTKDFIQASPYSSEVEDMESVRNSRKKASVNPNSFQFTSHSSRMTDPVKFDKFVISFLKTRGRPVAKMPSVDKKWLSFWSLFHAVYEFGGSDVVTRGRKWKQVAHLLLLPGTSPFPSTKIFIKKATLTSASYTLRTFFTKYLLDFEQFYVNHTFKESLDIYRDDLNPIIMQDVYMPEGGLAF